MPETRHEFFKRRLQELGLFDDNTDYGGLLGTWVEELSEALDKQPHSGGSYILTLQIFNMLCTEWDSPQRG